MEPLISPEYLNVFYVISTIITIILCVSIIQLSKHTQVYQTYFFRLIKYLFLVSTIQSLSCCLNWGENNEMKKLQMILWIASKLSQDLWWSVIVFISYKGVVRFQYYNWISHWKHFIFYNIFCNLIPVLLALSYWWFEENKRDDKRDNLIDTILILINLIVVLINVIVSIRLIVNVIYLNNTEENLWMKWYGWRTWFFAWIQWIGAFVSWISLHYSNDDRMMYCSTQNKIYNVLVGIWYPIAIAWHMKILENCCKTNKQVVPGESNTDYNSVNSRKGATEDWGVFEMNMDLMSNDESGGYNIVKDLQKNSWKTIDNNM